MREAALELLEAEARNIARQRLLEVQWHVVQSTAPTQCSTELTALLKQASAVHVSNVLELSSGAGHDAAMLAAITPVAMLFVRCKDGVSHHPDESVQIDDIAVALAVLRDFLRLVC
jgi:allantoate deiminase